MPYLHARSAPPEATECELGGTARPRTAQHGPGGRRVSDGETGAVLPRPSLQHRTPPDTGTKPQEKRGGNLRLSVPLSPKQDPKKQIPT